MKFTITPLGGAGKGVTRIVDAIVRYLQPHDSPGDLGRGRTEDGAGRGVSPDVEPRAGAAVYYADGGEEPGRWLGAGAADIGLDGGVRRDDFSRVLAGRDPRTGARLISAQGSAGRRPKLGVGNPTRLGPDGQAVYDARDAAAILGLPVKQVRAMIDVGAGVSLSGAAPGVTPGQPGGAYIVPMVDGDGNSWVTEAELSRCEEALHAGTTPAAIAAAGDPSDELTLAEAARLVGLTPTYLRRLAQHTHDEQAAIEATLARGKEVRNAYLPAYRDRKGSWLFQRGDLAAFVNRRKPPAVRVGYDLTLTTEKSLGVLALLAGGETRAAVLDAIEAGNDRALAWLERIAAAARVKGKVVPVKGWTVASFRHLTSRALDPFPHHRNVVCNTVEDGKGVHRALDARQIYANVKGASALATAEMRYQLTTRLGVRWRPGRGGGWEVDGIGDPVLREFSRRRNEIEDALRELEDALGRGAHPDAVTGIALKTRPAKLQARVDELVAGWWSRAEALGLTPDGLAAVTGHEQAVASPEPEQLFRMLAAPDGICLNLSVFHRGDVLAALANLAVSQPGDDEDQPLIVPADELERLADDFLRSRFVERIAPGGDGSPARCSTREMLSVQRRIVDRYRSGLASGRAVVPETVLDRALEGRTSLTGEQRRSWFARSAPAGTPSSAPSAGLVPARPHPWRWRRERGTKRAGGWSAPL